MINTKIRNIIIVVTLTIILIASGTLLGKIVGNKHIFTIGQEKIYQDDLNKKISEIKSISNQNNNNNNNHKKIAKQRLIQESRILQKASKENLVELDSSFYNSRYKNNVKRKKIINKIINNIQNDYSIKGEYIALWFVNIEVGPLGYDEAKKRAYQKISELYESVKKNELTMKEAGKKIMNDPSLEIIDQAYKGNAYKQFEKKSTESITFNLNFNKIIKNTPEGHLTPLYAAKDKTKKHGYVEAVYIFAKINEKKSKKTLTVYDWLNEAKQEYEIQKI